MELAARRRDTSHGWHFFTFTMRFTDYTVSSQLGNSPLFIPP